MTCSSDIINTKVLFSHFNEQEVGCLGFKMAFLFYLIFNIMVVFKSIVENEILEMNFCEEGLYVQIESKSSSQLTNFIIPNNQLENLKLFILKGE